MLTVGTITHASARTDKLPDAPARARSLGSLVRYLLSPASGTLGQGIRFVLTGGFITVMYLGITSVLADVLNVPFQIALATGFTGALGMHFTLQRWFVWVHDSEFAHRFGGQARRYLMLVGTQYLITATTTSVLPSILKIPVTLVYFATALILASINFFVLRNKVFNAR